MKAVGKMLRSILSVVFFGTIVGFAGFASADDGPVVSKTFGVSVQAPAGLTAKMVEGPTHVLFRLNDPRMQIGGTVVVGRTSSIKNYVSLEAISATRLAALGDAFAKDVTIERLPVRKTNVTIDAGTPAILLQQKIILGGSPRHLAGVFAEVKKNGSNEIYLVQLLVFNVGAEVVLDDVIKTMVSGIKLFDFEIQAIAQQ